mmetsp:Transcript_14989/g.24813  ORF Transcript_14989/g.24813 Transcript_14989/m.24813 type:complete len:147 (+) Transcript_14989:110-550(+)|eukprot:CAMPEP_0114416834 /NCGR_PEP_ID=MMETSP0103-20121206/2642_1 /TAXON_ID=37642 ORGANISM="Paraphysomonas imperforata, Strain PA2" /NCGR_SAMPLE_ID=MMETSP0103 /ASSEMBLY_ACC=CAM_ASM_000201 /LENGTH=146 /DNA_ID=CAMNT_0001585087 /DNA_START=60 /DNA_END=500 /DNA_ORIENTATION=+
MNLLDNHLDCLHVTKHLIKIFEARRDEIQEQILGYESVGQLAVDFTEKQKKLAEKTIEEAMQEILDAMPASQNGQLKPTKFRAIDLPEFFAICELFYETTPEVKDDILYFERLFMPAGSYELLPDDNLAPPPPTVEEPVLAPGKLF